MSVEPYVESEADHAFTAFLAGLKRAQVLKDRSALFTKPERERDRFLRARSREELAEIRQSEIYIALRLAREMRENDQQKASK